MHNQEETLVLIEQLAEVIDERKKGYQKASDKITDPYLKELFKAHSNHCEILKAEMAKLSDSWESHPPHDELKWKYWFEMKHALKSSSRDELLSACIQGEQRSISLYLELIHDPDLSSNLKGIITKQFQDIKSACDLLKIFKICL